LNIGHRAEVKEEESDFASKPRRTFWAPEFQDMLP
jgi:hypothetical protein